jgi:flagella synthesis protein FlgN
VSLEQHLENQKARLERLRVLLTREQGLLTEGQVNSEELATIASEKQRELAEIEAFELQRRKAQQRLGYGVGRTGARQAASQAGCPQLWSTIEQLASEVSRLNQLNGKLIHLRLENNQRMLNFLQEAAGAGLYGPDGQAGLRVGQVDSRV